VRRVLLVTGAVVFFNSSLPTALAPLLPRLADEFSLSKGQSGLLTAAFGAGIVVGTIPALVLASRLGVKPSVLLGLGLMIASSVGFAFASTAPALELSRLTQGISVAIAWPSATAWLVGFGSPERRGELIGITARASIAGAVLGPVLGAIATVLGRALTFSILATAGVAVAIWAFRAPSLPLRTRRHPRVLLGALRQPGVGGGLWLGFVTALFLGVLIVLAPLDLHRFGWSPVGISVVFLVSTAVLAAAAHRSAAGSTAEGRRRPSAPDCSSRPGPSSSSRSPKHTGQPPRLSWRAWLRMASAGSLRWRCSGPAPSRLGPTTRSPLRSSTSPGPSGSSSGQPYQARWPGPWGTSSRASPWAPFAC